MDFKQVSVLDFIMMESANESLTYEKWCNIRRYGTPDEIADAVLKMEAMGGYDNLV